MIEPSYFWQTVIPLAVGTFLIRASFIFLSSSIHITSKMRDTFSFIPAAILPALFIPMVFFHEGHTKFLFEKERLIILLISAYICYFSKNMLLTIGFGLILLYLVNL